MNNEQIIRKAYELAEKVDVEAEGSPRRRGCLDLGKSR